VIALNYIHMSKIIADYFTKGLSRIVIASALIDMGLRPI
jgi:hypothetical protein